MNRFDGYDASLPKSDEDFISRLLDIIRSRDRALYLRALKVGMYAGHVGRALDIKIQQQELWVLGVLSTLESTDIPPQLLERYGAVLHTYWRSRTDPVLSIRPSREVQILNVANALHRAVGALRVMLRTHSATDIMREINDQPPEFQLIAAAALDQAVNGVPLGWYRPGNCLSPLLEDLEGMD
jgi:hypothetical protein